MVSFSLGNGPLCPETKSTHTHIPSTAYTVPALMGISSVPPHSSVFQALTGHPGTGLTSARPRAAASAARSSRGRSSGGRCRRTGTSMDAAAAAMVAVAQRRPVGDRYLHPLVEVHDQRRSRPPRRFTPAGGGNARCVQVEVITKAGEKVTRASALPFALDIMRRALPSWRPSRPLPSLFSSAHRTSRSGRL